MFNNNLLMKKVFGFLAIFLLSLGIAACTCSHNEAQEEVAPVEIVDSLGVNVEKTVSLDKEFMFLNYGSDYRWFETCILLDEFLDEECDGSVAGVSNVFQAIQTKDEAIDVYVVLSSHTLEASTIEVVHTFWVEDLPMNEELIKLTYKDAFDRVMATNYPKPHSQHVVLRKELGPKVSNPQYIFGNNSAQLYVDAVTGEVKDTNPVFEGLNLGTPLGEWP